MRSRLARRSRVVFGQVPKSAGHKIVVYNLADGFFATQASCTHVFAPLARAFDVAGVLPRWSGETLDIVVDLVTYVFVPAYAIAASGLLPNALAIPAGIVVVLTGALYFADRQMKTPDNYFLGFPAVWNLGAFYLYLLEPPSWLATAMIAALVVLTFAPIKFLHPLRVQRFRAFNTALLIAWAVLAFLAVAADLSPGPYVTVPLAAIALYFFGGPVIHDFAFAMLVYVSSE